MVRQDHHPIRLPGVHPDGRVSHLQAPLRTSAGYLQWSWGRGRSKTSALASWIGKINRPCKVSKVTESIDTNRVLELRTALDLLTDVARTLKHNRAALGALELESAEVRVAMDSTGNIDRLLSKAHDIWIALTSRST